jgi:hypothetical protein
MQEFDRLCLPPVERLQPEEDPPLFVGSECAAVGGDPRAGSMGVLVQN